jgi:TonB family protein
MGYGVVGALAGVAGLLGMYGAWRALLRVPAVRRRLVAGERELPLEEAPRLKNARRIERLLANRAAAARIQSAAQPVLLRFHITFRGRPEAIRIVRSSGNPAFDEVAVRTARQLRYAPARLSGYAVAVWVEPPLTFRGPG